ncbi:MAG: guanine deaminase [Abditibacteriales bacterium]|nr:guanine deaminase [Abditibacteriales bacterium]MDW8364641.1 guanine deaminase [Abditibacteriales bacterium]
MLTQPTVARDIVAEPRAVYRARLLNPQSAEAFDYLPDGALVVNADGTIAEVVAASRIADDASHVTLHDFRPHLLIPGLVDVHSHLPQYDAVAMDGGELLSWLQAHIFPAEARFANPEKARDAAERFFRDMLAHGTTTAAVYATIHQEATSVAFSVAERLGMRAIIGKVMMDQNAPPMLCEDTETSLKQSEELCQQWHGRDRGRLQYAFSPRFALTCSMTLMRRAGELARQYNAYVQTHLSENLDELKWVKRLFPQAQHYTDVYRRAGLLGAKTLMAHCVHLSDEEFDLLQKTDTRICHCPSANFFLKSGIMNLVKAMKRHIHVGIGTDVGAGPSLSLFREMGAACLASKARWAMERFYRERLLEVWAEFSMLGARGTQLFRRVLAHLELDEEAHVADPKLVFYLATLGGARALGLDHHIGNFAPGKDADFVVIDTTPIDPTHDESEDQSLDTLLSRLVYRGKGTMVQATFVRGRRVHEEAQGRRAKFCQRLGSC